MKRPYLVNFMAIQSNGHISVRTSLALKKNDFQKNYIHEMNKLSSPISSIGLMSSDIFRVKFVGMNQNQEKIFEREYETDDFGNLEVKFKDTISHSEIVNIQIYETSYYNGLSIHLGAFIPYKINDPKKILISDFDKTLVDTVFSTVKEVYASLSQPVSYFPTVQGSIEKVNDLIEDGFQPFILSASPHFYENSIRDWLYQNRIYAGNLFLKDYRNIFSLSQGFLRPKDMKNQGFYKLSQLTNILLMTGIPDELILIGDGFESDEFIYLILRAVLVEKIDPWKVWNAIKREKIFQFTTKQSTQFLTKFYKLGELAKRSSQIKVHIYIRTNKKIQHKIKNKSYKHSFVQNRKETVEYYLA
jgi:phosphatidate phosphatase APP1